MTDLAKGAKQLPVALCNRLNGPMFLLWGLLFDEEEQRKRKKGPPECDAHKRCLDRFGHIGEPEKFGFLDHENVEGKENTAAQIAQRKSEPRDKVDASSFGDCRQQRVVKGVRAHKTDVSHHIDKGGQLPVSLLYQGKRTAHQDTDVGKEKKKPFSQPSGIGDGPKQRCQKYDDHTRKGVGQPQVGRTGNDIRLAAEIAFKKEGEEAGHDGCGVGGVCPVV